MGLGNICQICISGLKMLAHNRNAALMICFFVLLPAAFAQNNTYKNPKLESILSQLISSDDPQTFARTHNLYMKDGSVRVVVELSAGSFQPPGYAAEETRSGNMVQMMVPIKKIDALSMEPGVNYIRTPSEPYSDTSTPVVQTTTPRSGSSLTFLFIISIIIVSLFMKRRRR